MSGPFGSSQWMYASGGFYGFPLEQSLRFNDDDSAYLSWTPASAGNRKTWTWSGWVKRSKIGSYYMILASDNNDYIRFDPDTVGMQSGNTAPMNVKTTAVLRDPSAWYHLVFALDTTQATASDRFKIYINGTQATDFSATTYPALNAEFNINNTTTQYLGRRFSPAEQYFDGYMAEVNFIDGTALTPASFGEFKENIWIPKDPSGLTYGTNGFRLSFADDAEVEAFNTVLYRGNGGTQSVTGMGFEPDLVWIKNRDAANSHVLFDQVRGTTKRLITNSTNAESTVSDLQSFDSDGFSLNSTAGTINASGNSYVAWCWKAGDSNVSNTDGSITSTVRANTTYGFSIVSYTGNGSNNSTVGHGLNSVPDFVITKNRDNGTDQWGTWHSSLTSIQYYIQLNTTGGEVNGNDRFGTVDPTTSVMNLGYSGSTNSNGANYIMYCWAEKANYSSFGSYTGTGSSTGPTVTCGFKPAMIILKRTDSSGSWTISDNTRDTVNPVTPYLFPHDSAAEATDSSNEIDFNDTGFQIKHDTRNNTSGATYIYAAFADTREAAFWLDQTSNDNDWQPVNLDHNDTVADSPTNNFCTMNPIAKFGTPSAFTLADGNLDLTFTSTSGNDSAVGTMGLTSGKWYHEVTLVSHADDSNAGFTTAEALATETTTNGAAYYKSVGYHRGDRAIIWGTEPTPTQRFTTLSDGSVLGFALDLDSTPQTLKIYLNGGASPIVDVELPTDKGDTWIPCCGDDGGDAGRFIFNFGQQPFKYDPPA